MAKRITPTTKRGYHTYTVEGEDCCPNCSKLIPEGRKSCPNCGVMRYWVEHEYDTGADFTVCDPKCMALRQEGRIDHECRGIHDPAHPDCFTPEQRPPTGRNHRPSVPGGRFVERCDQLADVTGFDSDEAAAQAFGLDGDWIACSGGGRHYFVRG